MKRNIGAVAVTAIAAALLCLVAVGVVAWRAQRALGGARREVARGAQPGLEVRTLEPQPNPGFERIDGPGNFKSFLMYQGHLYLTGQSGLYVYATDGTLEHVFRTGIELPAAPLGQLAVGMLTGAHQPELLIATFGAGIVSFDGHTFRQILGSRVEAREVTAVLPLASGRLLIGTAKLGLLIYDGATLQRFHPTTDNVYVTALAGTEGDLWVGTLNDGLLHWHGGQTERIGEEQQLPDRRVEHIAIAADGANAGRAYVGTPMGVAEMRDGKVARVLAKGRFAHALIADGDSLLVGQMEAGILRVSLAGPETNSNPRRPIRARVDEDLSAAAENPIHSRSLNGRAIAVDFEPRPISVEQFLTIGDNRYALLSDGLLKQGQDGSWRRILGGGSSDLADSNVSALLAASDGRLWIGYFDRGMDVVPATGGKTEHVENEHVFCVNRIVEDARHGAVAVATANGLVMFDRDGRQKQMLGREAGLIADHVSDVALYGEGMALATPAGITFLDQTGAHSLYAFQGLVNNHVYALGASGNELVAGTLGGLSLLAGGQVRRNLTIATSGLKHNWITGLAAVGNEWLVGTYGAGVLRLAANGSVTATDATRTGMVVNPTAIVADGRMVLAGTLSQGLLVGDATGTRWRTVTAGLPSLNVTALAVRDGVVYVGTESGLVKISEDRLQ